MKRREFITLLGGAVATWPLAARAQQAAGKPPIIGYIGGGGRTSQQAWLDAFVQRLRERGWIEGRTVTIEVRWGEGRRQRYAEIAAEFVRLNVDVILAGGTEAAIAAKQATSTIPIVFPTAGDPVGSKLVASQARPGGNVTGLSNLGTDLAARRLEILREAPRPASVSHHGEHRLPARSRQTRSGGGGRAWSRNHTVADTTRRGDRHRRGRTQGPRAGALHDRRPVGERTAASHQHVCTR